MSLYRKVERIKIEDHSEIDEYGPQLLDIKVKYSGFMCRNISSENDPTLR